MKLVHAEKLITGLILSMMLLAVFNPWTVAAHPLAAEFDCSAQTSLPADQCEALVAIYQATGGENWTNNTGWLQAGDPCQWHGVACFEGNVVALDLFSNNLTGALPIEIGGFPHLNTLTLNGNPLNGAIPLTITFMNLDLFHFHNTSLCEPSDPNFQDWLLQIVYRLSSGIYCSALTPTAAPLQAQTQPAALLWPQQTLTALAGGGTSGLGEKTLEPTPTKYYNLESPTPTETPPPPSASEGGSTGATDGLETAQTDQGKPGFFSTIPRGWLLVLTIPLVLIVIGVLLELRDRKKEREERRRPSKLEWGDIEERK